MTGERSVACSLSGGEMAERGAEWRSVLDGRLLAAERDGVALRLTLRDSPGLGERLARLVELEATCCPFLALRTGREEGRLILLFDGPPEARPVIDLFAEAAAP